MVPETQGKINKSSPKKFLAIILLTFTIIMVLIAGGLTFKTLNFDGIYQGVFVNDFDVGNFSKSDLETLLKKNFKDNHEDVSLTIKSGNIKESVRLSDLDVVFDINKTVDNAYNIGRNGNIISRILEIAKVRRNNVKVEIPLTYSGEKLGQVIDSIYSKTSSTVKESQLIIKDDKVVFLTGHSGKQIKKEDAVKKVEGAIKECKSATIELEVSEVPVPKVDVDAYFKQINQDAKDASLNVDGQNIDIIPHSNGRKIDKSVLASVLEEAQKHEDTETVIPVSFSTPKVTIDNLKANLFKDYLGSMGTSFSTTSVNDSNRGVNIRLAVSKINGKVLLPGEEFSFNKIVGPRTAAGGYKVAHTFVGGKVVDGIGGGICQVSTTLYNAVLYSDLNVTQRSNHMFAVGYVQKGLDAAVSYPDVDFKFKNSTTYPIKIEGYVSKDNRISFSIKGTKETPNKTVQLHSKIVQTLNFETVYKDDPNMEEGKTSVLNEGKTGYVVDSFKIVKIGGKVVDEKKIHTSRYRTLNKEVKRGTKKASTPNINQPGKPTPKPSSSPGVDDAGNPPATSNPTNDSLLEEIPAE
ncbi:MAG: VanW family protein [Clostridia bacterium]|nr:VanW family protein [Clostridia bacterium]